MSAEKPNAERLLQEHNYFYQDPFGDMKAGYYWCLCGWQGPDRDSYWKHLEALQPVPSDGPNAQLMDESYEQYRQRVSVVGQPSLEKLRKLEVLRDEMYRASDNRFAANYAIQTPGESAGYVIPANKAQEWADRLQAVLAAFEKEGK